MNPHLRTQTIERTLRPWGWYETVLEVPGHKVKRIGVLPGAQISLQKHQYRAEHWVAATGLACITVGERVQTLGVGGHVDMALGQVHRLANLTAEPLGIIEVQFADDLGADDIVRVCDDDGRP
jgi:mannose-6-phosphate isomerase-like protein (cupin superfamily)